MRKVVRIGTLPTHGGGRVSVYCKIETQMSHGNYASFSGVIGPSRGGNAYGGCGQIDMGFAHRDPADNDSRYSTPTPPEDFSFAPGWDAETWLDFLDAWNRLHLKRDAAAIAEAEAYAATLPDADRAPAWV
jgi:hypothetical protein